MKKSCAALTCFNSSVENPTLTFFPFPSIFKLAKRWAIQASRDDLTKSFTACRRNYLCSEHFESFYFEADSKKTRFKSGFEPLPTIFQGGSSNNLSTNVTSFSVDANKYNQIQRIREADINLHTLHYVSDEFGEYKYSGDPLEEFGIDNGIVNQELCHNADDLCRLCADKFPKMELTSLFETRIGNKYLNMLLMWLPVKVSKNDGLPEYICGGCGLKLEQCSTILRKFVVAYNKLRDVCSLEQTQNQQHSKFTNIVAEEPESNENLTFRDTVSHRNTDTHSDYTLNVIKNECIPASTIVPVSQIKPNITNIGKPKIENITTANVAKLTREMKCASETEEKHSISVVPHRALVKTSRKANILTAKYARRYPAKQSTRRREEEMYQTIYKCSECSKLLSTRDDLFAHYVNQHPMPLQGPITCTMIRVTDEMRNSVIDLTAENRPSTINNKDDAIVENTTTAAIENDPLRLEQDPAAAYGPIEQVTIDNNTLNSAPVIVVPVQNVDLTAVDTCFTESILRNILTCVTDLPAATQNISQIDTSAAKDPPPTTTNIKPVPLSKPTERNLVLKYECSLCFKLLITKKELINHCLTVHALSKQDSVVCKVIKVREKQQYSRKSNNIINMTGATMKSTETNIHTSTASSVSEKENILNRQIQSTEPITTSILQSTQTGGGPESMEQYRFGCPYCTRWLNGKMQLIYHCIVHHAKAKSDKIVCKVEKSVLSNFGKSTQRIARFVQGMIIQDKHPDIELPTPDFTAIDVEKTAQPITELVQNTQANIDLPLSDTDVQPNNNSYQFMFECAKCEERLNTKQDLVHHCYVNKCFIAKDKIMCKEVKLSVPCKEQIEKYKCLRCMTEFLSKDNLIKHSASMHPSADRPAYRAVYRRRRVMRIHDTDNYRKQVNRRYSLYKCNYCEETFARIYGFNEHLKRCLKRNISLDPNDDEFPDEPMIKLELMHTPRRIHESRVCIYCGKVFCSLNRLKIHERIHTNERPYKCSECSKMFRCSTSLANHKFSHSTELNYVCHLCGKRLRSKANLYCHVKKHTDKPERRFECEICKGRYSSLNALQKHKEKHTELRVSHRCTTCNKLFMTNAKLEKHIEIKHGNKLRFQCPDCPKAFQRKYRLLMHRNTHTGEKPYLCEICGKAFSNMGVRYQHQLIHFAEKRFMCDVCGNRFRRVTHLNAHKLIHSGVKPFKCDVCGKTFAYQKTMATHKRKHQQATPEPEVHEPQVIVEEVVSCEPSDVQILIRRVFEVAAATFDWDRPQNGFYSSITTVRGAFIAQTNDSNIKSCEVYDIRMHWLLVVGGSAF
ncbi:Meiotic central spindle [Carabus blaptoides fortunei]